MTVQEQADHDEAAAIARYFTLRQTFHPCWGTTLSFTAPRRPGRPTRVSRATPPSKRAM